MGIGSSPNVLVASGTHAVFSPEVTKGLRIAYTRSVTDSDAVHQSLLDKGLAGKGLDLLFTASWPAGVTRRSKILQNLCPTEDDRVAHKPTAALVEQLRPRYHFTVSPDMCGGAFCQREPYANSGPCERTVVRSPVVVMDAFQSVLYQNYRDTTLPLPVSDHKCPTKFSASTRFIALSQVGVHGYLQASARMFAYSIA